MCGEGSCGSKFKLFKNFEQYDVIFLARCGKFDAEACKQTYLINNTKILHIEFSFQLSKMKILFLQMSLEF